MEKHLGRSLTRDEIVHHLNGIRDDNRIENLTVTTRKDHEHYTYVKALQARIRALETTLFLYADHSEKDLTRRSGLTP